MAMSLICRSRNWQFAALVCLVISIIGGCASDRAVINQANQMHSGLEPAVVADPELSAYLQEVGNRIIREAKKHQSRENVGKEQTEENQWMFSEGMRFHFVNSDTLNAFTTGGEHMYIYTELFEKCRSEDELAAVMAHEYAHVYGRHVHKGMNRQYMTLGAAAAAGAAGYAVGGSESGAEYGAGFAGAALVAGQFIGMGFTRKDEAQADELGFELYSRAGWDPKKFGDFFQQMIDLGYDKTPEMMSDHPTLASRVEDAKKRASELPSSAAKWRKPPVADEARLKQLQARAAQVGKSMPNDQTLAGAQKILEAFPSCFSPVDQPKQKEAREEVSAAAKQK